MENRIELIAHKRGYVVTEEGELINPKGKRIGSIGNTGYEKVNIKINKEDKRFYTHRLQAFQKYGSKLFEKGICVRHLDNNKLNNSWDNIAIGTQSENMIDIPEQIRIKRAINASSKIKKHDHEEIQKFYDKSKSYKKTMEKFNISSKGTLHFILNK